MRDRRELLADVVGEELHAEQRLVRAVEIMRAENKRCIAEGKPAPYPPGIRLESVAAAYPICRRRCMPALQREGATPLTAIQGDNPATRATPGSDRGPEPPRPSTRDNVQGRTGIPQTDQTAWQQKRGRPKR